MAQWQFDHLTNLRHLLSTPTNVVVAYVVQARLRVLNDWLTFSIHNCVRYHNRKVLVRGFNGDNSELQLTTKAPTHVNAVSPVYRSEGVLEVRYEVGLGKLAALLLRRLILVGTNRW